MKNTLIALSIMLILSAFQSYDNYLMGYYAYGTNATLELKADHTFKEIRGDDWRNGMWKVRRDTILLQEGLSHHSKPGYSYPYSNFFLAKTNGILIGKDLFQKAVPAKSGSDKK